MKVKIIFYVLQKVQYIWYTMEIEKGYDVHMSVKLSTFARKMEIFFMLLGGRIISRQELTRRFSIDRVIIHRDITTLSQHMPISNKIGRYGGIYLIGSVAALRVYLSDCDRKLLTNLMNNISASEKVILYHVLDKFSQLEEDMN